AQEPGSFCKSNLRIRVRVDEDMTVIERTDQADLTRKKHAVSEYIARHVADADDGERHGLHIDTQAPEMGPYRFPRTSGRDAHALVVVAGRTAGCEGVAEPDTACRCQRVGD